MLVGRSLDSLCSGGDECSNGIPVLPFLPCERHFDGIVSNICAHSSSSDLNWTGIVECFCQCLASLFFVSECTSYLMNLRAGKHREAPVYAMSPLRYFYRIHWFFETLHHHVCVFLTILNDETKAQAQRRGAYRYMGDYPDPSVNRPLVT